MTEYFVATSGGSDSNDGLDIFGFTSLSANWDAAEKTLFHALEFLDYTWESGDKVYLSHASITDGLYEIASKIDSGTIELVESISGSDQAGVTASDGPWATVTKAKNTVAAGDNTYLCTMASGEVFDSEAAYPVNFTTSGSDATGWIWWFGANSHGTIDGTITSIKSNSASSDALEIDASQNVFMYTKGYNGDLGWDIDGLNNIFYRCVASDSDSDGFDWGGDNSVMIECLAHDNGGDGFFLNVSGDTSPDDCVAIGCVARNNGVGFRCAPTITSTNGERIVLTACTSYDNGVGFHRAKLLLHCISYNQSNDNIDYATSDNKHHVPVIINSLTTESLKYGVDDNGNPYVLINNGVYLNVIGDYRNAPINEIGTIDLSADPFIDAPGEDFGLNGSRGGLLAQTRGTAGCTLLKPANQIDNPGFDTTDSWTYDTGEWTIANGEATQSAGTTDLTHNDSSIVVNMLYETIFTITDYTSGTISIQIGDAAGTARSATGTYRQLLTSTSGNSILMSSSSFRGSIDDIFVAPVYIGPNTGTQYKTTAHMGNAFPQIRRLKVG